MKRLVLTVAWYFIWYTTVSIWYFITYVPVYSYSTLAGARPEIAGSVPRCPDPTRPTLCLIGWPNRTEFRNNAVLDRFVSFTSPTRIIVTVLCPFYFTNENSRASEIPTNAALWSTVGYSETAFASWVSWTTSLLFSLRRIVI